MLPAPFGDALWYLRMAGGLSAPPPYNARVLTPWLASFAADPRVGFVCITVTATLALCALYWHWHGWHGLPLLLTLFYPTLYFGLNPYMVDPLLMVTLIGAAWALTHARGWLAAALFVIGAFNKEVILIAVPLLIWYRPKGAAIGAVIAVAVTLWLRWPLLHAPPVVHPTARLVASGIIRSGMLFAPLVIANWHKTEIATRRTLLVMSVGVAPLVLGAADTGRMLGLLAPFWIPIVIGSHQSARPTSIRYTPS